MVQSIALKNVSYEMMMSISLQMKNNLLISYQVLYNNVSVNYSLNIIFYRI